MTDFRSDEQLMVDYALGDGRAFRILFARYWPLVLRRVASQRHDADDLVQQTFLHLHRARHDFDPSHRFRPWLLTIALNVKKEHYRKRRRRPELLSELDGPPELSDERSTWTDFERTSALRRAVERLPRTQREVLELRCELGLSFSEVARTLGITVSAVKVRAHRGYVTLRDTLQLPAA